MPNEDGEFRGATRAQIEFLKDQLREIRTEMKSISTILLELRDFKTKVLAYAAMAAAVATFGIQFLTDRLEG